MKTFIYIVAIVLFTIGTGVLMQIGLESIGLPKLASSIFGYIYGYNLPGFLIKHLLQQDKQEEKSQLPEE